MNRSPYHSGKEVNGMELLFNIVALMANPLVQFFAIVVVGAVIIGLILRRIIKG